MQVTKNYIEMCEQAEEIQKLWEPKKGDWLYWEVDKSVKLIITLHMIEAIKRFRTIPIHYTDNLEYHIWLPTQEQLQKLMPKTDIISLVEFIRNAELRYHDKFDKNTVGYFTGTFETLNELWLAFVMKERWGKIWVDGVWKDANEKNKNNRE